MSIYEYTVLDKEDNEVSLEKFKDYVVLIVNTATECGFTPQYTDLARLYDEFEDKKFTVIEFPCNQFGGQAPGTDDEIQGFCRLEFGVKYPIYKKIDVNGENEEPLFAYLKSQKGFEGFTGEKAELMDGVLKQVDPDYENNDDIKWNFTKFLIDRNGEVVARFEPTEDMQVVEDAIKELL
jgi:glutathione peroxidase